MSLTRRTCLIGLLAAPAALPAPRARASVLDIADAGALAQALRVAAPGTTLRLAPGRYEALTLKGGGGAPGAPVTLAAADPDVPPHFSRLDLRGVAHLALASLRFDYRFTRGDKVNQRPFKIAEATGVVLQGCGFTGDRANGGAAADNGFPAGIGLSLTDCSDTRVEGCNIATFLRGIVAGQCRALTVRDNDLRGLRVDGMDFVRVRQLVVDSNRIHDFERSFEAGDHADMIQFWTNGSTEPSADITIRRNLLYAGQGDRTQSIFMRNEEVDKGRAGPEMFYRNVLIEENVIANAHVHGIAVGETQGLTIQRNAVLSNPRAKGEADNPNLWIPAVKVAAASTDVVITRNVTGALLGGTGGPGWVVKGNVIVQDHSRLQPGFFPDLFDGDPADPAGLRYRPGGPLDGAGIGPPQLQG